MAFEPYPRYKVLILRLQLVGGYWLWLFCLVAWTILLQVKCLFGFHRREDSGMGRIDCIDCWRTLEHYSQRLT